MKFNEVKTTLKHPESFHGNVKNLSKRMKMKDKGECHFYLNGSSHQFEPVFDSKQWDRSEPASTVQSL